MYDNEYEIRVFGIKHGGQHAIINWIATLFDEPVYFFNNCGWNSDPYRTGRTTGKRAGTDIEGIFVRVPRLKNRREEEVEAWRVVPKKCLMYSYENTYMDRVDHPNKPATPFEYVGKSEKIFDVLILRDIFNLAASTFKYTARVFDGKDRAGDDEYLSQFDYKNFSVYRDRLKRRFDLAAKEFLGRRSHMRDKKICISFNDWFKSKGYRERMAAEFGLPNNEVSIKVVAGVGGRGSRFDDFEYDGRAHEMKVLERWKHFEGNRVFWELMYDWMDTVELSNEIFGEIPGTMEYVRR